MKTCSLCPRKYLAKGLCRLHYYADKRKTVESYRIKANTRASAAYTSLSVDERRHIRNKRKERQRKKLDAIKKIVSYSCALKSISPCDESTLCQDHDHACDCGNSTGCSKCFRGFLCRYHNVNVLPVLEKLNSEFVPDLVKNYLLERPLLNTGIEPLQYRG